MMALADATRSPRVLATSRVQPCWVTRRRPTTCKEGAAEMKKMWIERSQVQIQVPAKFSLDKSLLKTAHFSSLYILKLCMCEMYYLNLPVFYVRNESWNLVIKDLPGWWQKKK